MTAHTTINVHVAQDSEYINRQGWFNHWLTEVDSFDADDWKPIQVECLLSYVEKIAWRDLTERTAWNTSRNSTGRTATAATTSTRNRGVGEHAEIVDAPIDGVATTGSLLQSWGLHGVADAVNTVMTFVSELLWHLARYGEADFEFGDLMGIVLQPVLAGEVSDNAEFWEFYARAEPVDLHTRNWSFAVDVVESALIWLTDNPQLT